MHNQDFADNILQWLHEVHSDLSDCGFMIAMGSLVPELEEFPSKTPEITKAKSAIPITSIKKMERCLIFPKMAIIAFFDSLRN